MRSLQGTSRGSGNADIAAAVAVGLWFGTIVEKNIRASVTTLNRVQGGIVLQICISIAAMTLFCHHHIGYQYNAAGGLPISYYHMMPNMLS